MAGRGLFALAEVLTRDEVPSPSAYDPARNPHRSGIAWSKGAIRTILSNPRYTGVVGRGRAPSQRVSGRAGTGRAAGSVAGGSAGAASAERSDQ
ncbi:recombinase family protein [Amycolatopsis magusensis]|uniref:recombinase family protein n=1 Tax=Amycolatopsis magusensis TaxID=882444 RepID=UPI003C2FDEB9